VIPPFVRRCPDCGHVDFAVQFPAVDDRTVRCPMCRHRFETADRPWLQ
jgi:uncharacterized Zn finger protein (UPF0148 family)